MSGLNLVFAGTPAFGLPCLEALVQSSHYLKAIYTQPDRPSGRGRKMQASDVKTWALAHDKPIFQPINFKDPATVAELAALKPDVLIVIAYGLILPKTVLTIPKFGCINVHASLLPAWRGASPIQQAILHGDRISGVTIMQMDAGMDTGDMLVQAKCEVTEEDTAETLHNKLAEISVAPLLATIDALNHHQISPQKQGDEGISYAPKITKEQAEISWAAPARTISRQIRAYNPWPIAYTKMGQDILRIHQASIIQSSSGAVPGTILSMDKKGMIIAAGEDCICIEMLQFSGGKVLKVADWLNAKSKSLQTGFILG